MRLLKTIQKLTLATLLVLALSACSSKDNNDANTTEQTTGTSQGGEEDGSTTNSTGTTNDSSNDGTTTNNNTNTENNETNPVDVNTTATLKSLTLTLAKTTLNKDETTDLSLQATYANNTSKTLTNNIEWIVNPSDAVQITDHTLKAKKDTKVTLQAKVGNILSNTIALNITWVVNGHVLPPEPDKALNDSTLLGIDVNDNGVRDDVERWIYRTYDHPIERGIFMQSARAYNLVIVDPSKAKDTMKYIDNSSDCEGYWRYWKILYKDKNETFVLERYRDLEKEIRGIQFNTIKRHMAYTRFNGELSGGVYGSTGISKDKCEFNENGILKALK